MDTDRRSVVVIYVRILQGEKLHAIKDSSRLLLTYKRAQGVIQHVVVSDMSYMKKQCNRAMSVPSIVYGKHETNFYV